MPEFTRLVAGLAIALICIPGTLTAQQDRTEWLENCRRERNSSRVRHCEVREVPAAATRRLDVYAGANGGMSINGSDEGRLTIEARIQSEGPTAAVAAARAAGLTFTAVDGVVRVQDPGGDGSVSVIFHITAPRRTDVVARGDNGPVMLRNLEGTIQAEVTNGPLSLNSLAGDVRARTLNGPLAVNLTGDRWNGRGLEATAENGPVTLRIPARYSAELIAGTSNGPIVTDLPTVQVNSRGGRTVQTTLGSGGAPVKVTSVNGPAVIRTGDGRGTTRRTSRL